MDRLTKVMVATTAALSLTMLESAAAAPCLKVTLTGTQGGPPVFQGQAGAGTLVQFGDDTNNCAAVNLQFDTGRGTTQQLSKLRMPVSKLHGIFLTHMHSDLTEGLADILQLRWHFASKGPKVDLVCAEDALARGGYTLSCRQLAAHIGDPFVHSGEIAQRRAENKVRLTGGPADLVTVKAFTPAEAATKVWQSGDVEVLAIKSRHIAGHASYRVNTPAGSVVVGGDAGNDTPKPPRTSSTSAQVEQLSAGADIVVHSTIHPVMGPDGGSGFPPPIFFRQSTASDLGAMAQRAGAAHLFLTHLIPPLKAARQGPYKIPGGGLSRAQYEEAVRLGGFKGNIVVGTDLATLRLPAK